MEVAAVTPVPAPDPGHPPTPCRAPALDPESPGTRLHSAAADRRLSGG